MSTDYVQLNTSGITYRSEKSEDWDPMTELDPPCYYIALKTKKKKKEDFF